MATESAWLQASAGGTACSCWRRARWRKAMHPSLASSAAKTGGLPGTAQPHACRIGPSPAPAPFPQAPQEPALVAGGSGRLLPLSLGWVADAGRSCACPGGLPLLLAPGRSAPASVTGDAPPQCQHRYAEKGSVHGDAPRPAFPPGPGPAEGRPRWCQAGKRPPQRLGHRTPSDLEFQLPASIFPRSRQRSRS